MRRLLISSVLMGVGLSFPAFAMPTNVWQPDGAVVVGHQRIPWNCPKPMVATDQKDPCSLAFFARLKAADDAASGPVPVRPMPKGLAPIFPNCSAEFAASGNGVFCRPVWRRIVSDTGEVFRIDMLNLEPLGNGGVGAFVVVGDPRGGTNPSAFKHLFFDCRGPIWRLRRSE